MDRLQHCDSLLVTSLLHSSCRQADHLEICGAAGGLPDKVIRILLTLKSGEELPEISPGDIISFDYIDSSVHAIYKGDKILYRDEVQSEKPN